MSEKPTRARTALTDRWEPLGKWAMVKGELTCAKFRVSGKDAYVLFDGDKRIGEFESFTAAKDAAAASRWK